MNLILDSFHSGDMPIFALVGSGSIHVQWTHSFIFSRNYCQILLSQTVINLFSWTSGPMKQTSTI